MKTNKEVLPVDLSDLYEIEEDTTEEVITIEDDINVRIVTREEYRILSLSLSDLVYDIDSEYLPSYLVGVRSAN
jgi:hypothetical protein